MTWSIQASGNKQRVTELVTASVNEGSDKEQHARVKAELLAAIAAGPDMARFSIQASGHADETRQYESISFNAIAGP
jgi:hypothetical protein